MSIVSNEDIFTIGQASKLMDVTRSAIHIAIKNKRLKADWNKTRWTIKREDLEEYQKSKYSRKNSLFEGEPVFSDGEYSVIQSAKILNENPQKIYYMVRTGKLKSYRKGCSWIIKKEDLDQFIEESKENKNRKVQ